MNDFDRITAQIGKTPFQARIGKWVTLPELKSESDFTDADVLHKLKDFSKKALAWDTMYQEAQPDHNEDTQKNYDLREKMETYLGSCKHE